MNGVGVLQLFIHRYRNLYLLVAGYLVLLVGIAQAPRGTFPEPVTWLLLAPFFLAFFATVAAFANPESDLASEASGYPAFLLRLPLKTLTLAVWPIVGVVLWGATIWIALATLYMRPLGLDAPIWWPTVVIASLGVTFQAILWIPVRVGGIRLAAALIIPMSLVLFGFWVGGNQWPANKITAIYALEAAAATVVAMYAVSRARTTNSLRSTAREKTYKDRARARRPFRSPEEAQFWVEWKKQGRLLPLITLSILAPLSLPLFGQADLYEMNMGGYIKVNPWMISWLPSLPYIPLLVATILGMGAGRSYLRSPEGVYHLFFATRPLSSAALIRAKYKSISLGVGLSWIVVLLFVLLWLLFPADDGQRVAPAVAFLFERTAIKSWLTGSGLVALLILWTWRNQIVGAFADFAPVPSIRGIYATVVATSGGTIFGLLMSNETFLRDGSNARILGAILGGLLAIKLGLAIWTARRLIATRPEELRHVTVSFVAWPLLGAIFAAIATSFANEMVPNVSPRALLTAPVPALVALLLVPLVRPLAARLAVELGRHRK